MSRLFAKVAKFFRSRTQVGVDKAGNRYFTRKEEIDGILKENRWVIFKGEEDPTSIPVEWICWLNGQRKKAPTPQELMELEARREHVKLNVAKLKKQEEEKLEHLQQRKGNGKVAGPDLRSFIQQFPSATPEHKGTLSEDVMDKSDDKVEETRSSEPAGSGSDFKPGIWQPPT